MWKQVLLQDEPLAKKLVHKGFWVYFFVFLAAPIGYLLRMILSNELSVAEVGIFYSVLGLVTLLSTYNDLGITESLQYFIPKLWIEKKKGELKFSILFSFFVQLVMGMILFALLYFWAEWLAINHFHDLSALPVIKTLAFYFLGYSLIEIFVIIFVSFQDTFSSGLVDFLRQITVLIFTVIFWLSASLSIESYALAWLIGVGVAIIVGFSLLYKKYRHFFLQAPLVIDKKLIKKQISYAFLVFLTANVGTALGQIDQQVIVNILGTESAGYFSNFNALLTIFTLVATPLLWLLFPITTELITKKEHEKLWMLQHTMYTYFGILALVVAGFFVVFGQEIAVLLFWEAFRFSGYLLQYIAPFLLFNCWFIINFNILAGMGKIKERMYIILIALFFTLLFNAIFLIWLGKGLLYSAFILWFSWLMLFIGSVAALRKSQPFRLDWKVFGKNVLVIILLIIVMLFVKSFLSFEGNWWYKFGIIALFFLGYGVIILLMNVLKIRLLLKEIKSFSS